MRGRAEDRALDADARRSCPPRSPGRRAQRPATISASTGRSARSSTSTSTPASRARSRPLRPSPARRSCAPPRGGPCTPRRGRPGRSRRRSRRRRRGPPPSFRAWSSAASRTPTRRIRPPASPSQPSSSVAGPGVGLVLRDPDRLDLAPSPTATSCGTASNGLRVKNSLPPRRPEQAPADHDQQPADREDERDRERDADPEHLGARVGGLRVGEVADRLVEEVEEHQRADHRREADEDEVLRRARTARGASRSRRRSR